MTASRFAVTAILARRLSIDAFGQYAYSQWLVDIGFMICALGATGVASRYLAEYRHQPPMLVAILRRWRPFSFGLSFAGALAAIFGAWLSGLTFDAVGYSLLLCWGCATGLWGMHTSALSGLQRFDLIFFANLLAAAIMIVGSVMVPFEDGNLVTLFAIMATASTAAALIGIRPIAAASQGTAAVLDFKQSRAIFGYAINIWITALLWSLVWSRGEVPVIRGLLGDEAVARYAVALTLYGGAVAGVMLGVSGIAPQITRYWGEGQQPAAVSLCRRAMDLQLLLSGLGTLTLIWLAPELMRLGFGERYQDSAMLLSVLALGLPALTVASHNHLLQIMTDALYNRNTTLLGVILLLGFSWAGVSVLGLTGAAWSRAMTLLILSAITFVVCWRCWGSASLGMANVVLVVVVSLLSVLGSMLPMFDPLPTRLAACLVLSLVLLAWVKTESKAPVAPYLGNLLWNRIRRNR